MADYEPPLSPSITFNFNKPIEYAPPLSPSITFNFGVDDVGSENTVLRANFILFLNM